MDYLPTLLSLSLLSLSLLSLSHCHSISDLLMSRGLPAGLFPDTVRDYELDPNGRLQVFMDQPCTAKFETRVFFESVVRANLSYGGLIGVEGLSQEELFLWLPVKDIIVYDPSSGVLQEEVGRKELGFQVQR
ncbi:uncharacterized protein LOC130794494 isoform X4 [Actinidia eriantha]|uniref:uncharacterized protein LOC130794494 isoform X4 n=1 Tax=Actinidia eriantha TaxID=165200 RepID=UPI0025883BA6|nr:uncharacterized protein LOC130794494 isoform X4 [Actinidia eriantha]